MGLFKGMKDINELHKASKSMPRPSLGDALSQSAQMVQGLQQAQQVGASGTPGTAVIVSLADTGATINEHPVARMELDVTVPGRAPYRVTVEQPIPRLQVGQLQPGATVGVKVDPSNPSAVVLASETPPAGATPPGAPAMPAATPGMPGMPANFADLQAANANQVANAQVAAANAQIAQDPTMRLQKLAALKDQGLLTEEEFAAQKARILAEM